MTANELTANGMAINALRNGSRLSRLSLGTLPKKLERIQRSARDYRNALEAAVVARHGAIDETAAHFINLAATSEMQAQVCLWLLRNKLETMTTADVLSCTSALTKAREKRNSGVAALKLGPPTAAELQEEMYRQLYGPRDAATSQPEPSTEATQPPDVSPGHPSDCGACEGS